MLYFNENNGYKSSKDFRFCRSKNIRHQHRGDFFFNKTPLLLSHFTTLQAFREEITKDENVYLLIHSKMGSTIAHEEPVSYVNSEKRKSRILAEAFVVKDFSERLLIEAVYRKTDTRKKCFTSREKSLKWLLSLQEKNK